MAVFSLSPHVGIRSTDPASSTTKTNRMDSEERAPARRLGTKSSINYSLYALFKGQKFSISYSSCSI